MIWPWPACQVCFSLMAADSSPEHLDTFCFLLVLKHIHMLMLLSVVILPGTFPRSLVSLILSLLYVHSLSPPHFPPLIQGQTQMPSLWSYFNFPNQNQPLPSEYSRRTRWAPFVFHFHRLPCVPGGLIMSSRCHALPSSDSPWDCAFHGRGIPACLPANLGLCAQCCSGPGVPTSALRTLDECLLMHINTDSSSSCLPQLHVPMLVALTWNYIHLCPGVLEHAFMLFGVRIASCPC